MDPDDRNGTPSQVNPLEQTTTSLLNDTTDYLVSLNSLSIRFL